MSLGAENLRFIGYQAPFIVSSRRAAARDVGRNVGTKYVAGFSNSFSMMDAKNAVDLRSSL